MTSQAANEEAVAKTAEVFKEGETNLAILIMYVPSNTNRFFLTLKKAEPS